jgi:hypothetical protein
MIPTSSDDGCTRTGGMWCWAQSKRPSVWTVWLQTHSERLPDWYLAYKLRMLEQYT